MVEAIDASYGVGYIKGLIESAANPTKGAAKIIISFGRKASLHWFKNVSVHDLHHVKIYAFVRVFIAERFRGPLRLFLTGTKLDRPLIANLIYKPPFCGILKRCV